VLRAATGRGASAGGCFAGRDGARSTGPTPVASAPTRCTRGGASMPLVRDTVPAIRASTALATNVTGEPRAFAALAVTVWLLVPTVLPTVSVALARPLPFVVVLAGDALPPPAVTVHATLNPATGFPVASMALTTKGAPRGAPTRPVWASPETGVRTTTDGVVDSLPQARAMATAASENRFIVASPGSRVSCRKTSGRVRGAVRLLDTHPRAAADSAAYARPPTLCARFPVAPRADRACPDRRRGARAHLQRVERLPRPQDRAHRELLHPDRRPLDHDLPRPRPHLDPREQHRADDGFGLGLGGRRRRVYHSRDPTDGLRLGHQPGGGPGHGRRADGRVDDDPAAPRVDREGARHADLSGGDGLRRSADRRLGARPAGEARVPGVRPGFRLQVPDGRPEAVARRAGQGVPLLSRGRDLQRDLPGADGGGLHHRPQDRGLPVRRRVLRLPRPRPRPPAGGLRAERAIRIPGGQPDPRHEPGRDSRGLHLLHRRGRGRVGGNHRAGPLAPDDRELLRLEPQGPARLAPRPGRHQAPHR